MKPVGYNETSIRLKSLHHWKHFNFIKTKEIHLLDFCLFIKITVKVFYFDAMP